MALESDAGAANETGDQFGAAVAIGNVTGDSHADLVVGAPQKAPNSDPAGSGEIYVIPGASTGKGAGFSHSQEGLGLGSNEAGDHFGAALAVGDFDKDGHADIAAGVPGEAPNSSPASGTVGILPGAASGLGAVYTIHEGDAGETLTAGDKFGNALATGDVNGDGFADLLVGAPGKSYDTATATGAAFLFTGGPRQSGSTVSVHLGRRIGQTDTGSDNEKNDAFGAGVAMGDITGDGKAEAMIGVPGESRSGFAAAGIADQLSNLDIPATASVPIGQFSPMAAMQASPVAGATLGTVEYAYTDNIGRLVSGHQTDPDNAGSVQFTVISGLNAFTGQPALDEQADGRLQVFAQNINGQVWANTETTKDPQVWGSFVAPPGPMKSAPVSVRESDGSVVAFAVDANGVLWGLPQASANGGFTSWVSLGVGNLVGTPVAVMTGSGVKLFMRDTTGDIKTANYSAKRIVSGCVGLNATGLTSTPSVVVLPGSLIRLFARAADGSIVTQAQDATGVFPGTWSTVGTFTAAGAPSALLDPLTGKLEVVALGTDGAIYNTGETVQGSGVWRDWAQATVPGDNSATDPTAFPLTNSSGTGWAFVFRNSDNVARIYQARSSFGLLALTAGTAATRPTFTAHSLPAPPQ